MPSAFGRALLAHFGTSPSDYRHRRAPDRLLAAKLLALTTDPEAAHIAPEIHTIDSLPVIFEIWLPIQ